MGSLDTSTPVPGPALPDIPPCSTRELAVGLTDLFSKADGLALPTYRRHPPAIAELRPAVR